MPWKQVEAMNQRTEFVLKAIKTDNFRALCQEYGISPKTGYKWKERFWEHGLRGTAELSRKPKSSPRGLAEAVVCEIVRLKQKHRYWGPRKIRKVYERFHEVVPSEQFQAGLGTGGFSAAAPAQSPPPVGPLVQRAQGQRSQPSVDSGFQGLVAHVGGQAL